METKENKRKFPFLLAISAAVLLSFTLSFLLGDTGIFKLREIRTDYNRALIENHQLALENKKLAAEIRKLRRDPATIEKIAREELHFVSANDLVLIVAED